MSTFQDCGGHPFGQHLLAPFPADTPAFPWCNHREVNAFLGQVGEGQGERTPKSGVVGQGKRSQSFRGTGFKEAERFRGLFLLSAAELFQMQSDFYVEASCTENTQDYRHSLKRIYSR